MEILDEVIQSYISNEALGAPISGKLAELQSGSKYFGNFGYFLVSRYLKFGRDSTLIG